MTAAVARHVDAALLLVFGRFPQHQFVTIDIEHGGRLAVDVLGFIEECSGLERAGDDFSCNAVCCRRYLGPVAIRPRSSNLGGASTHSRGHPWNTTSFMRKAGGDARFGGGPLLRTGWRRQFPADAQGDIGAADTSVATSGVWSGFSEDHGEVVGAALRASRHGERAAGAREY